MYVNKGTPYCGAIPDWPYAKPILAGLAVLHRCHSFMPDSLRFLLLLTFYSLFVLLPAMSLVYILSDFKRHLFISIFALT